MNELKKKLDIAIMDYVYYFARKHDLMFDYWVADKVGEVACFGDYFVNFSDIRLDLEEDVPENIFFEWYDFTMDLGLKDKPIINYSSYLKGAR